MGRVLSLIFIVLVSQGAIGASKNLAIGIQGSWDHLNVFSQSSPSYWDYIDLFYPSLLMRNSQSGEIESQLAESFSWTNKNKSLQFVLRKDLKWSDGEPITTEDVAFTIAAHSKKSYGSIYLGVYDRLVENVEVESSRKLTIHFKEKSYHNLLALGINLKVLPKHFYGKPGKKKKWVRESLSSGPYVFDSFSPGKKLKLKKNPLWFGWKVQRFKDWYHFTTMTFHFARNSSLLVDWLKQERIDFFKVSQPKAFIQLREKLRNSKKYLAVKADGYGSLGSVSLLLNHQNKLFQSLKTRQALQGLLDTRSLAKKLFHELLLPGLGPWNQRHPGAGKNTLSFLVNNSPKDLLRQDGWSDKNKNGILEKDGIEFRFSVLMAHHEFLPVLTYFQQEAKKLGIRVQIEKRSIFEAMDQMRDGKFAAYLSRTLYTPPELNLNFWYGVGQGNVGGFQSGKIQKIMRQIDHSFDFKARQKLYQKVFKLAQKEVPQLFWFDDRYLLYFVNRQIQRPHDTLRFHLGMHLWR